MSAVLAFPTTEAGASRQSARTPVLRAVSFLGSRPCQGAPCGVHGVDTRKARAACLALSLGDAPRWIHEDPVPAQRPARPQVRSHPAQRKSCSRRHGSARSTRDAIFDLEDDWIKMYSTGTGYALRTLLFSSLARSPTSISRGAWSCLRTAKRTCMTS